MRFDRGSRALYASDGSNYRQIPIGLVVPRDDEDVIATVAACAKFGAPILPRGAGTSLAGQCCNVAVVLDFTKYMNKILELDPERRFARVQPGVVLDTLRNKAEEHHLTFGPDPSTHSRCTLGGMIGNNSCGTHSLLAGKTVDNVMELRILLSDGTQMTVGPAVDEGEIESIIAQGGRRGEIYSTLRAIRDQYGDLVRERYPNIPRRVSGYNLDELLPENGFNVARALVGTEGTCVIVLEAKLKLIQSPQHRVLVGLGYEDAFSAADHVPEILPFGPIGLEGFEGSIVDGLKRKGAPNLELLPAGRGILLVEFGSDDPAEADRLAQATHRHAESNRRILPTCASTRRANRNWSGRFANPGARSASVGARHSATMGRLGRRGGGAGKTGRLPARHPQTARRISLHRAVLRPFRARLHPHARHFRFAERKRNSQVWRIRRARRRSRRELRRLAFRRARRRPIARRVASQHVRPGVDEGVSSNSNRRGTRTTG